MSSFLTTSMNIPGIGQDVQMFAVAPREDCPHQELLDFESILSAIKKGTLAAAEEEIEEATLGDSFNMNNAENVHNHSPINSSINIIGPCSVCGDKNENWVCLTCRQIGCSRYIQGHMAAHNEAHPDHFVSLSFSDGSFWCYGCSNYVYSPGLRAIARRFSDVKFSDLNGDRAVGAVPVVSSVLAAIGEELQDDDDDQKGGEKENENEREREIEEGEKLKECKGGIETEMMFQEKENRSIDVTSVDDAPTVPVTEKDLEQKEEREEREISESLDSMKDLHIQPSAPAASLPSSLPSVTERKLQPSISSAKKRIRGEFTRETLIQGIKSKKYTKIAFLTGAGISVAAGIPDFRTPGTGLYAKVAQFGLPYPEAIFDLEYLHKRPSAFYAISKGFLTHRAAPVRAHRFMRCCEEAGQLNMVFTQNIDGLELDAGVSMSKLVQAHGHMRSAHCSNALCRAPYDISTFMDHVQSEKVLFCQTCKAAGRRGIVKPDIVFFGENLPPEFFDRTNLVAESDLVFVMGTSLKVHPFAGLLTLVNRDTPLVLVNRDNTLQFALDLQDDSSDEEDEDEETAHRTKSAILKRKYLFLPGEIEDSIGGLMRDLGWS